MNRGCNNYRKLYSSFESEERATDLAARISSPLIIPLSHLQNRNCIYMYSVSATFLLSIGNKNIIAISIASNRRCQTKDYYCDRHCTSSTMHLGI